jgi:hypothetical protein
MNIYLRIFVVIFALLGIALIASWSFCIAAAASQEQECPIPSDRSGQRLANLFR